MNTALVTGSSGFVGRHFTAYLRSIGCYVRAVDLVTGDDALDVFRGQNHDYDLVVHCAAVVGGRQVIDGDPLAQAANLELDAALFRWARRMKPGRVVYFSSSAAYPRMLQLPLMNRALAEEDIDFRLQQEKTGVPDQLYGWAKLTGENLAHRARQAGVNVTVVRPFSGYGSDQDASYPFPAFIDRALRREDPFTVWGNGGQVRDFIHISDIVSAVMLMVRSGIDGPVNLGSGTPVSMIGLARQVCAAAGYRPEIKTLTAEPAGVSYRVADVTRMRKFYVPRVSLTEGIRLALDYRKAAAVRG